MLFTCECKLKITNEWITFFPQPKKEAIKIKFEIGSADFFDKKWPSVRATLNRYSRKLNSLAIREAEKAKKSLEETQLAAQEREEARRVEEESSADSD